MGDLHTETYVAAADLSSNQYLSHVTSSNGARLQNVAGGLVIGILQNKPISGQHATVKFGGRSRIRAGAAMGVGVEFACNSTGFLVTADSGDFVRGITITAAASGSTCLADLSTNGWKGQ